MEILENELVIDVYRAFCIRFWAACFGVCMARVLFPFFPSPFLPQGLFLFRLFFLFRWSVMTYDGNWEG